MQAGESNVVVLGFDERYAPAGMTALFSMFLNSKQRNFETVIITDQLSNETISNLDHIGKIFSRKIVIKRVSSKIIESTFPISGHITSAAYFRLFAPEMIECKNLLWIDSDTIIHCDVSDIFNFNDGTKIVYGVNDNIVQKQSNNRLNLPSDELYLNSGVLLIDRKKWIDFQTLKKCSDYAVNKDKIRYWDQCILNKVVSGKKGTIPDNFNTMQHAFDYGKYKNLEINLNNFRGIIHYTTEIKPWHSWCNRGLIEFYQAYSQIAPYKMKKVYAPESDFAKSRLEFWLSREGW